ncbi:MAG: hypothetical protein WA709_01450 [Stellaceae bacterium]
MRKTNRPYASRGNAAAWRVSAALVALTSLGSGHLASAQEIPAIPIPQQPFAQPVPRFIGQPASLEPITALPVPEDPYMAPNGRSNIHMDAYQSDTYATGGPLGHAPRVKSATLLGIGGTVTFDSAGRIVILVLGNGPRRLFLLDPVTLGTQWVLDLPPSSSSGTAFGGGGYYFLDELDRAVIPTVNQQIWIVQVRKSRPYLEHVNTCDLSQLLGQQISDQSIQSVFPDAQGLLWFTTSGTVENKQTSWTVTSPALVGTLVFQGSNQCTVKTLALAPPTTPTPTTPTENESISKSFAVDPVPAAQGQGGVFIVSDYAMYRFDAAPDGTPQITWREAYDRGTPPPKPGQIQVGSGTTPTLMGTDFVTIADNANPIDVLVYRRAAQVQGSRLVCKVPVFEENASATENSLIATNQSIVVENNYGYYGPQATLFNRATTPGITRIDLNADQSGCNTVWTNNQESIPSVVSQMSLANGLIYTYTKDPDSCSTPGPCYTAAWYLTAIDFASGQTVFKRLGGTGLFYNNHYSAVYLGPDQKTAYVGVIGGLIAIRDRY